MDGVAAKIGGRPSSDDGTLARRRPGDATSPATAVRHRWPHARQGDVITIELSAAHQHLIYEAPLSQARADTLVGFLAEGLSPTASSHVLDVGCGWGQLLLQVLDAVAAAEGIGVDIDPDAIAHGRDLASSRGMAQRADLRCADARTGSPTTADAVICIGASQIWGPPVEEAQPLDYGAALGALRALVPRGGRVVYGESTWSKTPTPEAIAPLAGRDDEHLPLPALLEVAVACGFAPLLVQEATVEEWDVFESGYAAPYAEWLAAHETTDPDRAEVEQRAMRQRSSYFRGYRGILGLAYLGLIAV